MEIVQFYRMSCNRKLIRKILACRSETSCRLLQIKRHSKRRFRQWTQIMIRFSDGHINVYDASTHAEIISAYDSEIERSEMKVLSLAGSKSSYSATVHNVLYDKKRPEELPIKLYTPNRYFYQTILRRMDKKSVKSAVMNFPEIKHDATIGLAAGTDHDSAKWEIVIGASGGTETLIRPCNKCNFLARKFHSKSFFYEEK